MRSTIGVTKRDTRSLENASSYGYIVNSMVSLL